MNSMNVHRVEAQSLHRRHWCVVKLIMKNGWTTMRYDASLFSDCSKHENYFTIIWSRLTSHTYCVRASWSNHVVLLCYTICHWRSSVSIWSGKKKLLFLYLVRTLSQLKSCLVCSPSCTWFINPKSFILFYFYFLSSSGCFSHFTSLHVRYVQSMRCYLIHSYNTLNHNIIKRCFTASLWPHSMKIKRNEKSNWIK